MTALKAHEVARYICKPDLAEGLFLAYGPDAGLVRETATALAEHFASRDAETVILEGSDLDKNPGQLIVEAKSGSLFAARRIVRVRNAGKSLAVALSALAEDPSGAIVVLEAGNLLPRDPLRALVETTRNGRALPCYPDNGESLAALARETFAAAGIKVDPDVISTLRESLGNDRDITRRELEKLVLFAGGGGSLSRDDVLTLCADNGAMVLDEIIDSAATGHGERLERALDRAISGGIDPQRLLSSTLIHFSALRRWRGALDGGRSTRDVLDSARPKPHFSRRAVLEQQLRSWSDPSLAMVGERINRAIAESRRNPALAEPLLRRLLVAISRSATGG